MTLAEFTFPSKRDLNDALLTELDKPRSSA